MEASDALSDAITLSPRVAVDGHRRRSARLDRRLAAVADRGRGVLGPLALAWGLAAVLIIELVKAGGFWQVAANTRILDVLVRSGIVPLTDTNIGLTGTMPDVRFYVESNDYIDFIVVFAAVAVMLVVWWLKAVQFHDLARFCGVPGRFGAHARASFYGHGIERVFPFGMGSVASAAVLEGQGVPRRKAAQVVYLANLFVAFGIVVFALYAMAAMGYTRWLGALAFPVGILALSYFVVRPVHGQAGPLTLRGRARLAYLAFRALDGQRALMIRLAVLSAVSFLGSVLAVYLIAQGFSTKFVQLNAPFEVFAIAVIGGYVARLVTITPGGLGQWEWGFALPLWASGMAMSDAVSLALLMTGIRYMAGGLVWLVMMVTSGAETNFGRVMDLFRGRAPAPSPGLAPAPALAPMPRSAAPASVTGLVPSPPTVPAPGVAPPEVLPPGEPDGDAHAPADGRRSPLGGDGADGGSRRQRPLPPVALPTAPAGGVLWPRLLGVVGIAMALFALDRLARLLAQYWLLKSMGFSSVFWTNFEAGAALFVIFAALYVVVIAAPARVHHLSGLAQRRTLQVGLAIGAVAGYFQALNYNQYLLLWYGQHWGKSDPVFHHDVSLYVFKLPAINHTLTVFNELAVIGLISSMICAWVASRRNLPPESADVKRPARIAARLATPWTLGMLGLLGVTTSVTEYLRMYGLLLKDNHNHSIYNGAQYVDVVGIWSTRHAIVIEALAVLLGTAMMIYRLRRLRHNVYTPDTVSDRRLLRMRWVLAALIPGLVLDFGFKAMVGLRVQTQVTPNEPVVQLPYIKRHIDWTNDGFDLNKITSTLWTPKSGNAPKPTLNQLLSHPAIANAPIWPGFVSWQERLLDPQHADRAFLQGSPASGFVDTMVYGPTLATYQQQQKLRSYYDFLDMDTTRYFVRPNATTPPQERIFASSVRELNQLQRDEWSQTWAQRNAIYTHGYGLVANQAQTATPNGEPVYASSSIPSQVTYPQLAVAHPDVYYGEGEKRMAFTDLNTLKENDYPTAQGEARNTYPQGVHGGVKVDSLLKRLVFGYTSGQFLEVLFSNMVGSHSRALYTRQPIERVKAIAPFLYDDTRPFAVSNGNTITWMVNGMTTSNRYPYSHINEIGDKSDRRTPFVRSTRWINYVRDSVKATVDAYTGQVHLYKWANEPVVNTYAAIYPKLFEPKSKMPAPVKAQVQYPTQLAHIQMDDEWIYTHVKDPLTYFAQEDLFDDADQVFGAMLAEGKKITFSIEPYYWMAKPGDSGLPKSSSPTQFAMSMIFTPENANNVRAIGTVYMDGNDYGRMSYLVIPKGTFFQAPQQADATIDQDPYVAQQLGFFNRRGVQLIRGHIMPLIADGELIYVEPLFIKSLQNPLPRLKRVLVVYRGQATMGQDLPTALKQALNPNPQFPIRPGPELGGEPQFRITHCRGPKQAPGCQNHRVVDQFNNSFAHDSRPSNAHG